MRVLRDRRLLIAVLLPCLIGWLAWRVDWSTAWSAAQSARWRWLLLAGVLNLVTVAIDSLRWHAIVSGVQVVPRRHTLEAMLLGWVGSALLPLKAGEASKAWALADRARLPMATVFTTVLLDRVVEATTFVLLTAIASTMVPLPAAAAVARNVGLLVLLGASGAGWLWHRAIGRFVHELRQRDDLVGRVVEGVAVLREQHRVAAAGGYAVLCWGLRAVVMWCAIRAFDLPVPPWAAVTAVVAVNLGVSAVAMPGNVGVFEIAFAAGLAVWHVPLALGVSAGLVLHAVEIGPVVALGLAVHARAFPFFRRLS